MSLPDFSQISTGTYDPTNYGGVDPFPAPAPSGTPETAMSVFNGTDANGVWKLLVVDDLGGDVGSIAGWSLDIRSCLLPNVVAVTDPSPVGPVVRALLCT
ncbi:MAG: proprotein convertase P-domain-containing protein [Actinomycetota bacterium]